MVNFTSAQAVQEFTQGHLAMVINSSAIQSALLAEGSIKVMDARLPSFGSQPSVPTNSGSALSILSKDPVKQQASWELIPYLTSSAAYQAITTQIGYAPLRTSLASDLGTGSAATVLTKTNIEQLSRLVAWQDYAGPNIGQVEKTLEDAVSAVAFQDQPAASALSGAQQQATSLLSVAGIVVPQLSSAFAALEILLFVSAWNEYFWPLVVFNDPPSLSAPAAQDRERLRALRHALGGTEQRNQRSFDWSFCRVSHHSGLPPGNAGRRPGQLVLPGH